MKRLVYLIIDQLAGHWEESVRIEGTDLPPTNVKGYHERNLIPNFSHLIDSGLWVKRPWNRGECHAACAMKYLATGSYSKRESCYDYNFKKPWYIECEKEMGFFEFAKRYLGDKITAGVFSCSPWLSRGYFYIPEFVHSLRPGYRDETMLRQFVFPWMETLSKQDILLMWNLVYIYFPTMSGVAHCPSYKVGPSDSRSSTHKYLVFLDGLMGEMINLLKASGLWEEVYIVIASDHGYHLGCSVAAGMGVKTNNWSCGHSSPWDCELWDFQSSKSTGGYSGGPRRTTFILSGGDYRCDTHYRRAL